MLPKRFVYVLRSVSDPTHFYTGVTANVRERLAAHNAGECNHTARHRPWNVHVVIAFREETKALEFERYLKSGSGVVFAQRHLR
jgi:putative endonuclease